MQGSLAATIGYHLPAAVILTTAGIGDAIAYHHEPHPITDIRQVVDTPIALTTYSPRELSAAEEDILQRALTRSVRVVSRGRRAV